MHHRFVDPRPVVDEHLGALAADFEPKIEQLSRRLAVAGVADRKSLRAELRSMKRSYRRARWTTRLLHRGIVNW